MKDGVIVGLAEKGKWGQRVFQAVGTAWVNFWGLRSERKYGLFGGTELSLPPRLWSWRWREVSYGGSLYARFKSLDFIYGSHRRVLNGGFRVWETSWLGIFSHAWYTQGLVFVWKHRERQNCLGFCPFSIHGTIFPMTTNRPSPTAYVPQSRCSPPLAKGRLWPRQHLQNLNPGPGYNDWT